MNKIRNYIIILITLTSCVPTLKNIDSYEKQFLSKTEFMPTKEQLKNSPPKIVVFKLEENEIEVAKQASLGKSIANDIENIIGQNRLGKIIDRKANKKLEEEIKLSELKSLGSYKGPTTADYAISGAISNASFSSKYSSGYTYFDTSGRLISIPPRYTYESQISGNIKIYELPSLNVSEVIEFEDRASRVENVKRTGGFGFGAIQIGGKQEEGATRDDGLVRIAGSKAISEIEVKLKNIFAKKGYILEKRILGSKIAFKISIGSKDGIKAGDKFEVMGKYETQNPITNETEIESKIIAKGVISKQINPKTSWVVIDNKKQAAKIRLGDIIKLKYKSGFFNNLF